MPGLRPVLFAVGLWCLPVGGASNTNSLEFETRPLEQGSIQWDINRSAAQELQERYRKRVRIPDAVGKNIPRAASAVLVNGPKAEATPAPPPSLSSGNVLQALLCVTTFMLTGLLMVRRFAPGVLVDINRQFNPWATAPAAETELAARIRAEEESFGKFIETFRIGPSSPAMADRSRQTDRIKELHARMQTRLGTQRTLLQDISRESSDMARRRMLTYLFFEMGVLKDESNFPEALPVWQLSSALEGLLKQLTGTTKSITPSTLRTVAGGLDLLNDLCAPDSQPGLPTDRHFRLLVVDDDLISRQGLSHALRKAFSQPDLAEDGKTALAQASLQAYDVIFLDVQMPGMDGFELCTKIRDTALNRTTPIVFVTIHSDFEARCKSTLSGGNDLMGKPFLAFEVTVKALTLALRRQLQIKTQEPPRAPLPEPHARPVIPENLALEPDTNREAADSPAGVKDAPRPFPGPAVVRRPSPATPPETDEITGAFLARACNHLEPLSQLCHTMLQLPDPETRQALLVDSFLRVNSLIPKPGPAVLHPAFHLSAVLEGLLRKMLEHAELATPSALATLAAAVDLLYDLCGPGLKADLATNPPIHILVVDDDLVSRRALACALQTAFEKPESAENGEAALVMASEKTFDVIFLDVLMPGMDGFEVCSQIRQTRPNGATPVIFVTSQSDWSTRARMSRNGGDDLMGKPFLPQELKVKALTFALRGRLRRLKTQSGGEPTVASVSSVD